MIKLVTYIALFSSLFSPTLSAQNLIPNPHFDDVNICHLYKEDCSPKAWRTTGFKSVKYHNRQRRNSRLQNSYIDLLLYDKARNFDRKFIQAELLCPLKKGEEYTFSIKIKTDEFHINEFGIVFFKKMFFAKKNDSLQNLQPDIILKTPVNTGINEWFTIEEKYIATGKEKIIMIGNFHSDDFTIAAPIDLKRYKKEQRRSYKPLMQILYGIDDVELIPAQPVVDCDLEKNKKRIYTDSIRHIFEQIKIEENIIETIPESSTTEKKPPLIKKTETIILNNIEFEFGKAILLSERIIELEKIISLFENNKNITIEINGYTDDIGSEEYNLNLSNDRAKAVFEYLIKKGIHPNRMTYQGFGKALPIGDNNTEEGRQINRRVEIVITEN